MSTEGKRDVKGNAGLNSEPAETRSLAIAKQGVRTGRDFANLMSALMTDLIEGKITPGVGNAACNAGGKLLKVVEMQMKYGSKSGSEEKEIVLSDGPSELLNP